MIEENVKNILAGLGTNPYGERVTLVAAVKLQSPQDINRAIHAGITDIGDNHVQEFRDKYDQIEGHPARHFIGHLQTNKIKYLLGKTDLYQSIDSFSLAAELSKKSDKAGLTSDILIEINVGCEESKSGFTYEEALAAYGKIKELPALRVRGLMAMLPFTDDEEVLRPLARKMRVLYDALRKTDGNIRYLSMGMSGDYKLCIECGSNMVRLGTSIFGARNYNK